MSKKATLIKLAHQHIELVRTWRNSDWVLQHMEYQEHISAQQQEAWFWATSKRNDVLYYIIEINNTPIGLAHLSDIDRIRKTASVGLFIGEKDYLGTGASFQASIELLDIAFEKQQITTLYAKVKQTNLVAKQYNTFLGFEFDKKLNSDFEQFVLTKTKYMAQKTRLESLV